MGKHITIDVGGVGYRVAMPEAMEAKLPPVGDPITVYTHLVMNPRDGVMELFGFWSPEELAFFELLTSISGIGPRSAQSVLARAELAPLQIAIIQGDEIYLRKVAGLGPKTAQRLILELKEKIASVNLGAESAAGIHADADAVEALQALGYSQYQARDAIKQLDPSLKKSEEKITAALKLLAKK